MVVMNAAEQNNFIQITPFMNVQDIKSALQFFTDILGFKVLFRNEPYYAYIEREGCGIRILESTEATYGGRDFAYYIDVRDVDALYAELKPKLDTLPPKDVVGPKNQGYGQRELLVRVPDGNVMAFGQAIKP
jgi:catechol 2,3-dioxygenase-like lactoylglutathione lyase family enzyme